MGIRVPNLNIDEISNLSPMSSKNDEVSPPLLIYLFRFWVVNELYRERGKRSRKRWKEKQKER
jgi:hypothetical protein